MQDEHHDETHDALTNLANELDAAGIFDEADRTHTAQLLADPEWTRPRWVHVHSLLTHLLVGISSADVWHRGYSLPPAFSDVVNGVAARIEARWDQEVIQISVFDYEQFLRECIDADPKAMAWNEGEPGTPDVAVVTRYSGTPKRRDFIDLGALTRNAAVSFLRESDRCEASEAKFDAEQSQ